MKDDVKTGNNSKALLHSFLFRWFCEHIANKILNNNLEDWLIDLPNFV